MITDLFIPGKPTIGLQSHDNEETDSAGTPRIDKGKGKAEPDPEVHEKILSPNFVLLGSDDEEDEVKESGSPDGEGETKESLSMDR